MVITMSRDVIRGPQDPWGCWSMRKEKGGKAEKRASFYRHEVLILVTRGLQRNTRGYKSEAIVLVGMQENSTILVAYVTFSCICTF